MYYYHLDQFLHQFLWLQEQTPLVQQCKNP